MLPDKETGTYEIAMKKFKLVLLEHGVELQHKYFIADYEIGLRNAMKNPDIFGLTPLGELFHFTKAILGRVKKLGLIRLYRGKHHNP